MTGIETITVVAATTADLTIAMGANDTQIAAGKTLTVNASALTNVDATLTFIGTASELDGSLSVTGGNGNDTITGGGFTDTLVGGIGVDVIAGGLSADNLTGGTLADTFLFSAVADSNSANTDTITDFVSGTDKLQVTLDYTGQTAALDINAVRTSAGVAGVTAAQDTLSAQRGQYVYDTTNSALFVNVNNDNLLTTLDYKININAASTASATIVNGDVNFVITGGTNADTITAGGGADTIIAAAGIDSITAGEGIDIISSAAGADIIVLTETTAVADIIVFGNVGITTATADLGVANLAGADVITGFSATDDLRFDISAFGLGGDTEFVGLIGNVAAAGTDEIIILTTVGYATDVEAEAAWDLQVTTANLDAIIIYFNTTDSLAHIIHDTTGNTTGVATLVGTFNVAGNVVAGMAALTAANLSSFA